MGILELDCVLENWKNGRFRPSEICSGAAGERSVQIERGRPGGAGGDGFPPCLRNWLIITYKRHILCIYT